MTDLQEMSDYLAEHLLGWRVTSEEPFPATAWHDANGNYMFLIANKGQDGFQGHGVWQPYDNIAQCFEYIVPAMEELKYFWKLDDRWHIPRCAFYKDHVGIHYTSKRYEAAAAIVEAVYKAIKEQE